MATTLPQPLADLEQSERAWDARIETAEPRLVLDRAPLHPPVSVKAAAAAAATLF